MLLTNMATPTSLMVTIWSLRSVPISLLVLMFVFNSGSISTPQPNPHFWFEAIAILGIVGIITAWNRLQRSDGNISLVIYLYIFLILILRNPYGILNAVTLGKSSPANLASMLSSLWVGVGIFGVGMLIEVLIFHFRQTKVWSWWLALFVSIAYVASIIFFFSGTLGIWSLFDSDTKRAFRQNN
jgi:hypothetical protein